MDPALLSNLNRASLCLSFRTIKSVLCLYVTYSYINVVYWGTAAHFALPPQSRGQSGDGLLTMKVTTLSLKVLCITSVTTIINQMNLVAEKINTCQNLILQ